MQAYRQEFVLAFVYFRANQRKSMVQILLINASIFDHQIKNFDPFEQCVPTNWACKFIWMGAYICLLQKI